MKSYLLPIFLCLLISININASAINSGYSSIEEVKELNYESVSYTHLRAHETS